MERQLKAKNRTVGKTKMNEYMIPMARPIWATSYSKSAEESE